MSHSAFDMNKSPEEQILSELKAIRTGMGELRNEMRKVKQVIAMEKAGEVLDFLRNMVDSHEE